jgi:hypothetical protein
MDCPPDQTTDPGFQGDEAGKQMKLWQPPQVLHRHLTFLSWPSELSWLETLRTALFAFQFCLGWFSLEAFRILQCRYSQTCLFIRITWYFAFLSGLKKSNYKKIHSPETENKKQKTMHIEIRLQTVWKRAKWKITYPACLASTPQLLII